MAFGLQKRSVIYWRMQNRSIKQRYKAAREIPGPFFVTETPTLSVEFRKAHSHEKETLRLIK